MRKLNPTERMVKECLGLVKQWATPMAKVYRMELKNKRLLLAGRDGNNRRNTRYYQPRRYEENSLRIIDLQSPMAMKIFKDDYIAEDIGIDHKMIENAIISNKGHRRHYLLVRRRLAHTTQRLVFIGFSQFFKNFKTAYQFPIPPQLKVLLTNSFLQQIFQI